MIVGRFGASDRPFLRAMLRLPRIGSVLNVSFLVDTGADSTSLSPRDWRAAGLNASQFGAPSVTITGYGGTIDCASEPADLVFEHHDGTIDRWTLDIEIAPHTASAAIIPSILGRDILRRYRLVVSPLESRLVLDPPTSP